MQLWSDTKSSYRLLSAHWSCCESLVGFLRSVRMRSLSPLLNTWFMLRSGYSSREATPS